MSAMRTPAAIALLLVAALDASASAAADWPGWRGAGRDGTGFGIAPEAHDGEIGVEVAWRRPLGSGYSSVSISAGLAVTMAAIDGGDWVVAFDATTGDLAWRYRVADTYLGRAGSDDGPSSTPALDADSVYALTAAGHVVALERTSGELRWRRHLEDDFGAEPYTYGYSAAPALLGDLLFLVGGPKEDSALLAVDTATGKLRWRAGSGAVEHHNPMVVTLGGIDQVVVPTARKVAGFDPVDGRELWSHEFESASHSGDATPLDGERLLITRWDGNTLLRIEPRDGRFAATRVWTTRDLEGTYAVPVRHGAHLYGFDSRFLTCVSLETGERVWRSRPPGGSALIRVDGLIATLSPQGELILAEAAPAGYREHSRLPLFAPRRIMTPPSVADGMIFVRSLDEVVALRPKTASRPAVVASEGAEPDSALIRDLLSRIRAVQDPTGVVDDFVSQHPSTPVVADGRVHFFYRGEPEDLVVTGDMTGGFAELPMRRLAGTDLFHRSFEAPATEGGGERWEYVFKSFDETVLDPRNTNTVATPSGERSVVAFPGSGTVTREPECSDCSPGRLVTLRLDDDEEGEEDGETGFGVTVYLPAGYDAAIDQRFPLAIWMLGREALEFGRIPEVLDSLSSSQTEPLIAAFLELPEALLWEPQRDEFLRLMSETVLPSLEERFRVDPEPAKRALVVQQWAIENGLSWVLANARIGKLAAQSPMMGERYVERAAAPAAQDARSRAFVYVHWGRYDARNLDEGLDVASQAAVLVETLEEAGHSVSARETSGGGNWTQWRGQTEEMITALFPARQPPLKSP